MFYLENCDGRFLMEDGAETDDLDFAVLFSTAREATNTLLDMYDPSYWEVVQTIGEQK